MGLTDIKPRRIWLDFHAKQIVFEFKSKKYNCDIIHRVVVDESDLTMLKNDYYSQIGIYRGK